MTHQGDVIFATWLTYDVGGDGWWLSMTANKTAEGTYGGTSPFSVYAKVAALPLANMKVAVPTTVRVTFAGSNGTALKAGPVVRFSCPR